MASRSLDDLFPAVATMAEVTIKTCACQGVDLLIYCTLRSPEEQAILYRQSRPLWLITQKCNKLREAGFDYIADLIMSVGPQSGPHVTNAAPGESFHQYKEAIDAVPLVNGKAMWDNAHPHWLIYGKAAEAAGLFWAGRWVSFKEYPHSQLREGGNPLKILPMSEIKKAFGV